uniref:Uncharacterized protein n=1 Tax=Fagus sylvatica TaxID=28930 RepID=A0A2N9HU46_FAGSY
MAIAVVSFFSGTRLYRNQKPGGSPLTRMCQVVVASIKKYRVEVPADKSILYETADAESAIKGSRKLEHTKDFSFFDKAAVEAQTDHRRVSVDPWRLCTVTQVEELKAIIRLLPIWATGIIFATVYGQMGTLFVLQGATMDIHVGSSNFEIPPAALSIFDTLSVLFWEFWNLKDFGLLEDTTTMNLSTSQCPYFGKFLSISFIGCAEVFIFIGQLEFFYEQAPDATRSMCSALSLTTVALGNYLSSLLVTIVTKVSTKNGKPGWIPDNLNYGHLDYFFWLLSVLSVLNLGVYLIIARCFSLKPLTNIRSLDDQYFKLLATMTVALFLLGFQLVKSMDAQKFLKKIGLGKEDYYFWQQVGKALLCTYTLFGAAWLYNETSPLGWWTLKPRPKEEKELAHLYERREFPYPGVVETDRDAYNYQKDLQNKKLEQEAQKLWLRMRNEVIQELQEKGFTSAIAPQQAIVKVVWRISRTPAVLQYYLFSSLETIGFSLSMVEQSSHFAVVPAANTITADKLLAHRPIASCFSIGHPPQFLPRLTK